MRYSVDSAGVAAILSSVAVHFDDVVFEVSRTLTAVDDAASTFRGDGSGAAGSQRRHERTRNRPVSPRYLGVMALVAVSGLLLVGCTREETEHMTPEQARDQTMSVLYGTMKASRITGWIPDRQGEPIPQGCKVGDEDGVTFGHGAYAQPENTDPAADAQRVVDYWNTLGIQSRVVTDPVIVVFGSGGPVNAISFATSPTYAISLGGICVPGDPFAYYDGLPTPPPPAP